MLKVKVFNALIATQMVAITLYVALAADAKVIALITNDDPWSFYSSRGKPLPCYPAFAALLACIVVGVLGTWFYNFLRDLSPGYKVLKTVLFTSLAATATVATICLLSLIFKIWSQM